MKRAAALLTALLLLCGCACAESLDATVITASATATLPLEIDAALITLTIDATGETLAGAEESAALMISTLTAALTEAGAAEGDILTSRGDVQTTAQYHYNKISAPRWDATGFHVAYTVTVTLRDTSRLAELVDAVLMCDVDVHYSVSMDSSREQETYRQALETAAKAAMEKAQALAQACGFTVEGVASVTELPAQPAGDTEVTAAVEVCLNAR